jgi:SAM-dependent methyltransferase
MEAGQIRHNWTDPNAYEKFMGRWSEQLARPFLSLADIPPGGRALDVACGTGVLTKAMAETGAHVIGIDASEGYLAGARRHRSHPNIVYENGDIRRMRFDNDEFDAAVSTLALDLLPKPEIEQVVAEMRRVTRPGGVVASGVHDFFGGMPAFDLVLHTGCRARRWPGRAEIHAGGAPALMAERPGGIVADDGPWERHGGSHGHRLRISIVLRLLGHVHQRSGQYYGSADGTLGSDARHD